MKRNIIEDSIGYRDLFDTKIMNCLMPRPSLRYRKNSGKEYEKSETATDYFYKLSQDRLYSPQLCKERTEMESRERVWRN